MQCDLLRNLFAILPHDASALRPIQYMSSRYRRLFCPVSQQAPRSPSISVPATCFSEGPFVETVKSLNVLEQATRKCSRRSQRQGRIRHATPKSQQRPVCSLFSALAECFHGQAISERWTVRSGDSGPRTCVPLGVCRPTFKRHLESHLVLPSMVTTGDPSISFFPT